MPVGRTNGPQWRSTSCIEHVGEKGHRVGIDGDGFLLVASDMLAKRGIGVIDRGAVSYS